MSWHPRTIGESVLDELRRFGRPGDVADVVAAWPEAVGEAIAENAWPARIARDGTLNVTTSSSVWAFELTKLEETIRDRLQARLGDRAPARLRFALGRLPERGAPEPVTDVPRAVPIVTPEARVAAAELAAPIEDETLRELVARAAAVSLARGSVRPLADRDLW
ncbi:MAG: DUF721 domain-containing protein [Actinobacteria bacterium]|nr:DUF721 domain-containing protein [Actinomycetota bacterium]